MCKSFGIVIQTTAAESPWSNGFVERHNLILADRLDKVLEETQCDLEVAVSWCANTKNSLSNIHGFSPYQLAISTNPKLPSMMSNRALALTATPSSKIICNNLKAIQKGKHSLPVKTLKRSGELCHTILEPQEILNTLQETMLT